MWYFTLAMIDVCRVTASARLVLLTTRRKVPIAH